MVFLPLVVLLNLVFHYFVHVILAFELPTNGRLRDIAGIHVPSDYWPELADESTMNTEAGGEEGLETLKPQATEPQQLTQSVGKSGDNKTEKPRRAEEPRGSREEANMCRAEKLCKSSKSTVM